MVLTGECFCGDVKYRIEGGVFDARSCHCSRCRKAFSGQASAYALVEPGSLTWVEGEDLLTSYTGAHGAGILFCRICGSTLCGTVDGAVHGVTLGCLNEDPDLPPLRHIFVGSKAAWEEIPEGAVQYKEGPPG